MRLTKEQEDHYAQMRYHAEIKEQDEVDRVIATSPYAKNERHVAAHKKRGDEDYANCKRCVKAADAGYYVPELNPDGW